jgi:hypothetical protein
VNRLSLTLGLAAMDTCWIYAWAVLLGLWADLQRPTPLLAPPSVFVLVLLGALSTQSLGRRAVTNRAVRLGLLVLGVVAVLVAVRVDQYPGSAGLQWLGSIVGALMVLLGQVSSPALAFALGLFVWWRGVRLGSQTASYVDVESAFRWGIGLLVSFALIMALTTRPSVLPSIEARTTFFVVAFFFVSLVTLALGRLESLRTRTRALGVNGQWLAVLFAVAGLIVLLALLVGQLLSFDLLMLATRPIFDLVGAVLLVLVYIIIIPLAWIVELLVYALLSLIRANGDQPPPQPPQPSDVDNFLQKVLSLGLSPELVLALKAVGAAILLGIGLLVVARALRRWRPSSAEADATDEERDSMWEAGRLRRALVAWLRALFRRGRRGIADSSTGVEVLLPEVEAVGLASIREVYRELLQLGETHTAPRAPATTPFEHMPSLQTSLEPEDDIEEITRAYVEVRYAEQQASSSEIQLAREKLERLHARSP